MLGYSIKLLDEKSFSLLLFIHFLKKEDTILVTVLYIAIFNGKVYNPNIFSSDGSHIISV